MRKWLLLAGIIGVVLLIDQATKAWVVMRLAMYESFVPSQALLPFFRVTRSFNTGAAFGFLANLPFASAMFTVVALAVCGVLVWSYRHLQAHQRLAQVAIGMIIGGALGNLIDRLRYDHVVDFIHYTVPGVIENVSNLADHAIVLGVGLMILASWRDERQPAPAEAPPDGPRADDPAP
jgi:signal peptidase II